MPKIRSMRQAGRPVAANSAGTEARILEAAREVFAVNGYAGTTMQKVADRAGTAAATLYHYFVSKDQLFIDVLRYTRDVIATTMMAAMDGDTPFVQQVEDMYRAALDLHEADWSLSRFAEHSTIDLERYPELREAERAAGVDRFLGFEEFLARRMATARARGEIRAAASDAALAGVVGLLGAGLVRLASSTPDISTVNEVFDATVHLLSGTLFEPGGEPD